MARPVLTPLARQRRISGVDGLLEEVNIEVAGLPDAALRALIPSLKQAEKELAADLAEVIRAGGGERFAAQQLRRALLQVRSSLKAVDAVRPDMANAMQAAGVHAGKMAVKHLTRELATWSAKFDKTISPIPVVPASKLAQGLRLDRFPRSAATWAANVRKEIRTHLSVAMLKGESAEQMAKRLMGRNPKGFVDATDEEKGRVISEALWKKFEYQARRVVRTEVIGAYNDAAVESLQELHKDDPRIMKRWDASIDSRTCGYCWQLDHTVVGPNESFPGGIDAPPMHPFCRCAVVAWREDWAEAGAVKGVPRGMVELAGAPESEI